MENGVVMPELVEHEMVCMEIWSGQRAVENKTVSRGMEAWIVSRPYHGEAEGGDVHYLSLCVGGIVTRLVLADVAGHGQRVAAASATLRKLLRRYMNSKDQSRLCADINREFTAVDTGGRFATAIIMTYLSHKQQLLLTNAGHPRPLFFSALYGQWTFLQTEDVDATREEGTNVSDLPLGIVEMINYSEHRIDITQGDMLVLYTDALTEAATSDETLLGESGLLEAITSISIDQPTETFGRGLLSSIRSKSPEPPSDDETVIVIRFGLGKKSVSIAEKIEAYWKLLTGKK